MRLIEHWSGDGLRIVTGQSMFRPHPWSPFVSGDWGIGLPRHGASRRRAHGTEQILDTNTGFFLRLGEEVEVAHFTGRTDEITFVDIDPDADDCLADVAAASGPIRITPDMTLTHRRLLRALRHSGVPLAIETIVVDLLTAGLAQHQPSVRTQTRRTTQSERQRLVNHACEILHTSDHRVGSSPWPEPSATRRSTSAVCSAKSPASRSPSTSCDFEYLVHACHQDCATSSGSIDDDVADGTKA